MNNINLRLLTALLAIMLATCGCLRQPSQTGETAELSSDPETVTPAGDYRLHRDPTPPESQLPESMEAKSLEEQTLMINPDEPDDKPVDPSTAD